MCYNLFVMFVYNALQDAIVSPAFLAHDRLLDSSTVDDSHPAMCSIL